MKNLKVTLLFVGILILSIVLVAFITEAILKVIRPTKTIESSPVTLEIPEGYESWTSVVSEVKINGVIYEWELRKK